VIRVLTTFFQKLKTHIENEEHKRVLKVSDELLTLLPNDEDVLKCKLSAYLQLSEFEHALRLLKKDPISSSSLIFEKAYCLYRLNRIEESLDVICGLADDPKSPDPRVLQLRAQLLYRLGRHSEGAGLYDRLVNQMKVESAELRANLLASYVAADLPSEALSFSPSSTFSSTFSSTTFSFVPFPPFFFIPRLPLPLLFLAFCSAPSSFTLLPF